MNQKTTVEPDAISVPAPAPAPESEVIGPPPAPPGPRTAGAVGATALRPQHDRSVEVAPVADVRNDGAAIGMPLLAAGSAAFALAVSGFAPVGALVPILVVAVIGEIVAARWAFRDGHTGPARMFVAFAGFWLTYVVLILGLGGEWFGIAAEDSTMAIVLFMVTWLTAMLLITLAGLEMPLVHTLVLLAVDVALVLLLTGTLLGLDVLFTAATVALLTSAVLAAYACVATTGPPALRRALPLGAAVLGSR